MKIALYILSVFVVAGFLFWSGATGCRRDASAPTAAQRATHSPQTYPDKVEKDEDDWKQYLTDEQFRVLRQCGTEPAFDNAYWNEKRSGTYSCAGCGLELFTSESKFASGSGWPSFFQPLNDDRVGTKEDRSYGMVRTEVVCNRCGGHLGHVFEDGPAPSGLRYCINSAALKFHPASKK